MGNVTADSAPSACNCTPSASDNCVCVPEALMLLNNAPNVTMQMLPQALQPALLKTGRTFRIQYSASVALTGLSCTGVVDLCHSRPLQKCDAFSGNTTYDATTCSYT